MTIAHDAYVALLAGLTTTRKENEKEIWWEDDYGLKITVEPLGEERYIIRDYYHNGNLYYEANYLDSKLHGLRKEYYYSNNKLHYENNYLNGQRNGWCKGYYRDGALDYECNYLNGKRHGPCKNYYENGQLRCESIYLNGEKVV